MSLEEQDNANPCGEYWKITIFGLVMYKKLLDYLQNSSLYFYKVKVHQNDEFIPCIFLQWRYCRTSMRGEGTWDLQNRRSFLGTYKKTVLWKQSSLETKAPERFLNVDNCCPGVLEIFSSQNRSLKVTWVESHLLAHAANFFVFVFLSRSMYCTCQRSRP